MPDLHDIRGIPGPPGLPGLGGSGPVRAAAPDRDPAARPHLTRMHDYLLGGRDNFAADRQAVGAVLRARPDSVLTARAVDSFTRRSATVLADAGLRSFLQLGRGIPAVGAGPGGAMDGQPGRLVYVADDAVALTRARIAAGPVALRTCVTAGDFREPEQLIAQLRAAGLLDPDRPLGLLLFGVLEAIPDDARARHVLQALLAAAPPGSLAAFFHLTGPGGAAPDRAALAAAAEQGLDITARSAAQVLRLVEGCPMLPPGLAPVAAWRPDGAGPGPECAGSVFAVGAVLVRD